MTNSLIDSVALFYKDETSDKVYNVTLEEVNGDFVVNFSYGRRGNALNTGTKTNNPTDLESAKKIYNKLIQEKQSKGYQEDGPAKQFTNNDKRQTGLAPMLLNPITEDELEIYIKDNDWIMQEKLDGKRIMVKVERGEVTASNRKGLSVEIPLETSQELSQLKNCIIDGELIGSIYYPFDLLDLNLVNWKENAYKDRYFRLVDLVNDLDSRKFIKLPLTAFNELYKRDLINSVRHKEGVVVKHSLSTYVPGRPNSGGSQLKCKFWSDVSVQVMKVNDKASILVGAKDGENVIPVGNVTIIGHDVPSVGQIVDVTYLYAFKGGSLIQPKYRGIRDDIDEINDISQLKYKAEDEDE